MDKNKLILSISILMGCILLGGFFYASQVVKQKSIESQQQTELQEKKEADQIKAEQDKRDYIAKRKLDCLAIYKTESDKWSNVQSWRYIEPFVLDNKPGLQKIEVDYDVCEIIYKDHKTGEDIRKYF
jgi:hypothetical protein